MPHYENEDAECEVWPPMVLIDVVENMDTTPECLRDLEVNMKKLDLEFCPERLHEFEGKHGWTSLLYIFPPLGSSYVDAKSLERNWESIEPKSCTARGWGAIATSWKAIAATTCSYAKVADMNEIDPAKQIVKGWVPLTTSKSLDLSSFQFSTFAVYMGQAGYQIPTQPSAYETQIRFPSNARVTDLCKRIEEARDSVLESIAVTEGHHYDRVRSVKHILSGWRYKISSFMEDHMTRMMWLQQLWAPCRKLRATEYEERTHIMPHGVEGGLLSKMISLAREKELDALEVMVIWESELATAVKLELDKCHQEFCLLLQTSMQQYEKDLMKHLLNWRQKRESILEQRVNERMELVEHTEVAQKETLMLESMMSIEATVGVMKKIEDASRLEKEGMEKLLREKEDKEKHLQMKAEALQRELQEARQTLQELEHSIQEESECAVCAQEMEGIKGTRKRRLNNSGVEPARKRVCFKPCNHAGVCDECASNIWTRTQKCPLCNTQLTEKPTAIFL